LYSLCCNRFIEIIILFLAQAEEIIYPSAGESSWSIPMSCMMVQARRELAHLKQMKWGEGLRQESPLGPME